MCTAITYQTKDNYFGRNLDLDFSYHEEVTICPRNYPLSFKYETKQDTHLAIIGMATEMLPLLNSCFGSCRSVKVYQTCVNNVKI